MSEPRERDVPTPPPVDAVDPSAAPPKNSESSTEPANAGASRAQSESEAAQKSRPLAQRRDDDESDDDDGDEGDEGDDDSDAADDALDSATEHEKPEPEESHEPELDSTSALADDALWGSIARSLALAGLLGFAIAAWVQLGLAGRSASDLLADNTLPPGQRMMTIKTCIGGAVLSAIGVGYWIWATLRKNRGVGMIERWMWFASPLLLAPAFASVLRFRPWVNQHERLLPIVLVVALVFEVLAFKALRAAPRAARDWWHEAREQLPRIVQERGPFLSVLLGSIFYAAFFSFYLIRWHHKLRTGNFDLSINNNLMFGGLHGHFLESPVVFPDDPKKYLANHAKFGGYFFLPLYALYPRPETLLVLQSTLIGVSALPLWGFARRHLSPWVASLVALAYLAYYPMHGASFSEFQYVPIAGFFVLTTIWAAEERRFWLFGVVFVMGITMREDIPIGMAVVGVFFLLSGYRPLPGLIMAAVSTIYFVVLRFHVMEEAGDWWFPNMYKELWADNERGFRSVIKTLLSNPLFVISKVLVEKKIIYLLHLFVPLAFLPVRRWYLWAAFIPGLLLTLLVTNYDPPITFSFHYVMHWAPYLFVAAVLALEAIGKRPDFGSQRQLAAALAMGAASLILSYNYGAFPRRNGSFRGGFQRVDFDISEAEEQRYGNLQTLIALIPPEASVAATEKLGPHVSSRVKMYTMRHGPEDADYALASSRELKLSRTRPKLLEALRNGKYGVMKRIADLALLKRGFSTADNERLIRDWRLVDARPGDLATPGRPPEIENAPRVPEVEGAPRPPEDEHERDPEQRGPE